MKSGLFFQAFFFSNPIIYSAQNSIIPPRLERIDAYNKEIDSKEKALAALNKRQFELMLAQDTVGMSALDKDIEKAEKHRDMLKSQLGQVMGANIRGQRGNQLMQGDSGSYTDGMLHAYGNIGDGVKAEQERKDEADAYQGMLHAYGNIGDGVKAEQERKDEAAAYQGMLHAYGNWNSETKGVAGNDSTHDVANSVASNPEHSYAGGTGGVVGNYQPDELREAQRATDIYDNVFAQIKSITGADPITALANIEEFRTNDGVINHDTIWGKAAQLLDEAYRKTGYTYSEALDRKKYFGGYQESLSALYIHEYANGLVKELTGRDYIDAKANIDELLSRGPALTGIWAEANNILALAEEATGLTYEQAVKNKKEKEQYLNKGDKREPDDKQEANAKVSSLKQLFSMELISESDAKKLVEKWGVSPARMAIQHQLMKMFAEKLSDDEDVNKNKPDNKFIWPEDFEEYDNYTYLDPRFHMESVNITEAEIQKEIIEKTQLKNYSVDQINVYYYDVDEENTFTLGEVDEEKKVFKLGDGQMELLQKEVLEVNEPVQFPYIPFVEGPVGTLIEVAEGIVIAADIFANSEPNYITFSGKYTRVEARIISEPGIIWIVTYERHPGGMFNPNSKIYIESY